MQRASVPLLSFLFLASASRGVVFFQISTPSLNPGAVGSPYSQQLSATGNAGPVIWSLLQQNLPPGFVFDTSAGPTAGTLCTGTLNPNNSANCNGVAPPAAQGSAWRMIAQAKDTSNGQVAQKQF